MARPRLGESERRTRTIGVRVTEAEETELRKRAQAARLSMGAYLRRRALGQRVRSAVERRRRPRSGTLAPTVPPNETRLNARGARPASSYIQSVRKNSITLDGRCPSIQISILF